jgi:hypothetical protein
MMSVGPIGSTLRHKKALGRLRDRGGFHYLGGFQQGLRRGGIMAERAEEERRDPAADAVAVAVYSVLVLLLMLAWTYVPA